MSTRTLLLTVLAMVAFALNSVLCRLVLGPGLIDAASFTSIRLLSGAFSLSLVVWMRPRRTADQHTSLQPHTSWLAPLMLATYAYAFSFAYQSLSTGTGALILFASVQITMAARGIKIGERFTTRQWFGLLLAIGGLVNLVLPGLTAPDPIGAALMATAGAAWGWYTILGRGETRPVERTRTNFVRTIPIIIVAVLAYYGRESLTTDGVMAASISGGITSGLGYVVWYGALPTLGTLRAGVVQLSVPIIAAIAGIVVLGEPVTPRFIYSAMAVILGIYMSFRR